MATKKEEKKQYAKLQGRCSMEKLNAAEKAIADVCKMDQGMTVQQYATLIYHWLMANKESITILDFYDDPENYPYLYSIDEVQEVKSKKIIKLLEQRIINASLKKEINASFAALLLQNHYGWTKEQPKVEVEVSHPIRFEFDK